MAFFNRQKSKEGKGAKALPPETGRENRLTRLVSRTQGLHPISEQKKRSNRLQELLRDEEGATAIEYGLICSLIVLAMVGGLSALASTTNTMWQNTTNTIETATAKAG
jgi:pilus assembly protein Flp/PilA